MGTSKKNRIFYYDNLKFFLILTVVIGHFADEMSPMPGSFKSLFLWIYSFHMPLFLFIGGMFHKNDNVLPKVVRFVMIGFVLNIGLFLEKLAFGWEPSLSYFRMTGVPWYMFVLAGYTVLSYLLRKMDKKAILIFAIILGLFSGYDSSLGDTLALSRFIVFYPFFVLGNMVKPDQPIKVLEQKWIRIVGIMVIAAWAIMCITRIDSIYMLRTLFTGRNSFGEKYGTWAFFYRGLAYIITLVSGFGVMCLIPKGKLPVATSLGERSIQIYFWHYFIIFLLNYMGVEKMLATGTFNHLVWLILAVLCTLVTGMKLFSFPTDQIVNLSRYAKDQTRRDIF